MRRSQLSSTAKKLATLLKNTGTHVVFAESCTGGLASAALTEVPGISNYHCGSAVVYRLGTKEAWLGISKRTLKAHGAVSKTVARQMAERVLSNTPEADVAASITGELGPNAPEGQDGLVFIGVAARQRGIVSKTARYAVEKHRLGSVRWHETTSYVARKKRQIEAAHLLLTILQNTLTRN